MLSFNFNSFAADFNFHNIISNKKPIAVIYGEISYLSEACNIP